MDDMIIWLNICMAMVVVTVILLVVYIYKVKKLQNMYDKTLAKFNNTSNIKETFDSLYERLNQVENTCETVNSQMNLLSEQLKKAIQKIGLVKYNALGETDNKLSFVLAMLDENDNGIVVNNVYSKHGNVSYCRLVDNGKLTGRSIDEEVEAIDEAKNDKAYVGRKEVQTLHKYKKTDK